MASCFQVLTRPGWLHLRFLPRQYDLFTSVSYSSIGNVSKGLSHTRSNAHWAKLKVQEKPEIAFIPVVCHGRNSDILPNKYCNPDPKFIKKPTIETSHTNYVDEQKLNDGKDLLKSKQADQQLKSQDPDPLNRPSPEQVEKIAAELRKELPNLFAKPHDFMLYHKNLVFENHFKGTVTTQVGDYANQIAILKIVGHLKYAFVELQVLKLTVHPSEGTIKVRWHIRGLGGFKVFINFWKYKVWNLKGSALKETESWMDGFSIFYVKGDGLIHKHVVLKMQPDEDQEADVIKPDMTAKLA